MCVCVWFCILYLSTLNCNVWVRRYSFECAKCQYALWHSRLPGVHSARSNGAGVAGNWMRWDVDSFYSVSVCVLEFVQRPADQVVVVFILHHNETPSRPAFAMIPAYLRPISMAYNHVVMVIVLFSFIFTRNWNRTLFFCPCCIGRTAISFVMNHNK